SIEAIARHMVVSKVRGRFGEFSGAIHIDEDPAKSWAEATIRAGSIDTGAPDRDAHLRAPDFLDVENYPEITFKSTSLAHKGGSKWEAQGDLTIRGVALPIKLDVEFGGVGKDPFGNTKALFAATGQIDREAYGMIWNQALETGGVLVSKNIAIELNAQVVQQ
ncbi:MAG: YceI family protein, partial [Actinomycetota bacterium]